MTPYARSKQMLEKAGYWVGRTEMWNSFARIRQDLFGIHDLVAIHEAYRGVLGVQITSGTNVSSHVAKALANESLAVWLQARNRFQIQGWVKAGKRNKPKKWKCRIINFYWLDKKVHFAEFEGIEDIFNRVMYETENAE